MSESSMLIDLCGRKFGRLTVVSRAENKNGKTRWNCLCSCGNEVKVAAWNLKNGHTRSCGCLQREATSAASSKHKEVGTHLYTIWADMKARCTNPKSTSFPLYGARGVTVCVEWRDYLAFRTWAMRNGYEETLSLDRIDPNGNYEPSNCRWITVSEQHLNKRNTFYLEIDGIRKPAKTWCKETGAKYRTVFYRKKYGGWGDYESLYGRKQNAG